MERVQMLEGVVLRQLREVSLCLCLYLFVYVVQLMKLFVLLAQNLVGDEDYDDDPEGDDGPRLIKGPCKLVDHTWETCVNGTYVDANGVLFRRSCYRCSRKFRPGTMSDGAKYEAAGIDTSGMFWVNRTQTVSHCLKCRVCLCVDCFSPFAESQGLMDDKTKRSPRKKKVDLRYSA